MTMQNAIKRTLHTTLQTYLLKNRVNYINDNSKPYLLLNSNLSSKPFYFLPDRSKVWNIPVSPESKNSIQYLNQPILQSAVCSKEIITHSDTNIFDILPFLKTDLNPLTQTILCYAKSISELSDQNSTILMRDFQRSNVFTTAEQLKFSNNQITSLNNNLLKDIDSFIGTTEFSDLVKEFDFLVKNFPHDRTPQYVFILTENVNDFLINIEILFDSTNKLNSESLFEDREFLIKKIKTTEKLIFSYLKLCPYNELFVQGQGDWTLEDMLTV